MLGMHGKGGTESRAHRRRCTTKKQAGLRLLLRVFVPLCTLCAFPSRACTIFQLEDSGFAANAVHLLHMEPIFGGDNNGTLFVDASKFAYKCSEGGG